MRTGDRARDYDDPPGTLREIKVFAFWGEYGRKAET